MAYDNLLDPETGLSIGAIENGKIIGPAGVQIGYVANGIAHGMDGEAWGPLGDAAAQTGAEPMPDAMRRALRPDP